MEIFLLIKILVIILVVLLLALLFAALYLAKYVMASGVRQTYEEAFNWQKEHLDISWFKESRASEYLIEGHNGYILHALFYPNENPSDKYMILTHGYTDNRYGNFKYMKMYLDLGFNIIIYDVRGHGKNEFTFTSYGVLEALDLMEVIKDTRSRYNNISVLGLHGESLGAATTLTSLKYKPDVNFAICDCPFSDIENVLRLGYKAAGFPTFLVDLASIGAKLRYGHSFKEMQPIKALANNELPVLFMHGADDSFIIPKNSQDLFDAAKSYKEIYFINGANHAESVIVNPTEYALHVSEFLKHINV